MDVRESTTGENVAVSGRDAGGGQGPMNVAVAVHDDQSTEKAYAIWAFGDDASTASITASAVSDSPPVDMRKLRREEATLHIVITGTGTAKLTVLGSRDGINNLHSLGDRITGMVVGTGSYILRLDDINLAYFPFYTFRITETGGSNSVAVKAYLVARGG